MKYRVEARTVDTHELRDTWYANTLAEACDIVDRQRRDDYTYGEYNDYEYATIPMN